MPPTWFCASLAADPLEIRRTLLQLRQRFEPHAGQDTAALMEMVVAEILNNIAEHGDAAHAAPPLDSRPAPPDARGRKIHVSAATASGGIYCIISDEGDAVPARCFDPPVLPQFRPSSDRIAIDRRELPEGGFGWFLIQTVARKLYYDREGRRNVLGFLIPDDEPAAAA